MIKKKKLELLDEYDDAAFALMMDEYAEEEGARLWEEFEEAMAAGQVPEVPKSLDEKCLEIIHQDFRKRRRKSLTRKILQTTAKAAVAVLVFLGVAAATVVSVDAFRIPVLNYLVTNFDWDTKIDFKEQTSGTTEEGRDDFLATLLPTTYNNTYYDETDGLVYTMYETQTGNYVTLDMTSISGDYYFDSENAECEPMQLQGFDAFFVEKDSRFQLIWFDPELEVVYHLTATEFGKDDFIALGNALAQYYK